MGGVNTIGYRAGNSLLHRLDPRTKQLLLLALSLASLTGSVTFLTVSSLAILIGIRAAGLRLASLLHEVRFFLVFLVLIFLIRTISFSENWMVQPLSPELVGSALIVCWRLLLVVLMCLLLMATTKTTAIRAALIWMLAPLPLVNERACGTMVGLLMRFLPLILLQAGETSDALRARGIEQRKNPLRRLTAFSIPLFRRVFLRADELVDTMQARCYSDQRTLPLLHFARTDLVAGILGIALALTCTLP